MSSMDPLVVHPYWLERQIDPAGPDFTPGSADDGRNVTHRRVTTVGTLARPERAAVDPRGLVTPDHAGWSVDWWIGAEDRWHLPSRARTVRQRLLGGPVVETALRVPGGDVLHRAYGFLSTDLGPCVAIEIENRSAVPVAVALAVRPYHPLGPTEVRAVEVDGPRLLVDGWPALILAKPPAEARVGDGRTGDVAGPLLAGEPAAPGVSTTDESGRATAVLVSPLAHTAVLRAVVPLGRVPASASVPAPDAVPAAEQVAKGWDRQARRGLSVELPDPRWQEALDAAVPHLLLAHGGEDVTGWPAGPAPELADVATVLGALGHWGFGEEVAEVLATWPERQGLDGAFASHDRRADAAGAALAAVAEHWRLTADAEIVGTLVGPVAKAVHWIGKRRKARRAPRDPRAVGLLPDGGAPVGGGPAGTYLRDTAVSVRALTEVAEALAAADQPGVADDARRLAGALLDDLAATIDAVAPGSGAVPATPSRGVDAGIVVNVDLFEPFGPLALDHPSAAATLAAIRDLPAGETAAVPQLVGPAGLSPALTAQLAVLEIDAGDPRAAERIDWLVGAGGPAMTWPAAVHPRTGDGSWGAPQDHRATALFLLALRRLLVREVTGRSGPSGRGSGHAPGLAVCSIVPPTWLGQSLDVRRAPTALGRFSYSIRWHGERPAILWELEPHPHVTALTLTAPGLDPSWSATGFTGEALLAPVPVPGSEPEAAVPDAAVPDVEEADHSPPAAGPESPVVLRPPGRSGTGGDSFS